MNSVVNEYVGYFQCRESERNWAYIFMYGCIGMFSNLVGGHLGTE